MSINVKCRWHRLLAAIVTLLAVVSFIMADESGSEWANPGDGNGHRHRFGWGENSWGVEVEEAESESKCRRVVCYYPNYAQFRGYKGVLYPGKIHSLYCTHIVFYSAAVIYGRLAMAYPMDLELIRQLIGLKKDHRDLKILLAVGGEHTMSWHFQHMLETPTTRHAFYKSAISFVRKHKFDGLSVDGRFYYYNDEPQMRKSVFTTLLTEFRREIDKEVVPFGKSKLIFTAAVAGSTYTADLAYDVQVVNDAVDFINLMAFDFYGGHDHETGHPSPLKGIDGNARTVKKSVEYWIGKGARKDKLVVGIPTYGKSFLLKERNYKVGTPASLGPMVGNFSKEPGVLGKHEICLILERRPITGTIDQKWSYEFGMWLFIHGSDTWVAYENDKNLNVKVQYILDEGLGGAMVWDIGLDDFTGDHCDTQPFPVLRVIFRKCMSL